MNLRSLFVTSSDESSICSVLLYCYYSNYIISGLLFKLYHFRVIIQTISFQGFFSGLQIIPEKQNLIRVSFLYLQLFFTSIALISFTVHFR